METVILDFEIPTRAPNTRLRPDPFQPQAARTSLPGTKSSSFYDASGPCSTAAAATPYSDQARSTADRQPHLTAAQFLRNGPSSSDSRQRSRTSTRSHNKETIPVQSGRTTRTRAKTARSCGVWSDSEDDDFFQPKGGQLQPSHATQKAPPRST